MVQVVYIHEHNKHNRVVSMQNPTDLKTGVLDVNLQIITGNFTSLW